MSTPSLPPPPGLLRVFRRRWTIPVLAQIHRGRGARFATIVHGLGVGRPVLRQTLDECMAEGWIEKNPGYGHPLRPEYILTSAGRALGPVANDLMARIDRLDLADLAGRKWSMPLLNAVDHDRLRFGELRWRLASVTDRALTLALKRLIESGLIERRVTEDFPPATLYLATRRGRLLQPDLQRLAQTLRNPGS